MAEPCRKPTKEDIEKAKKLYSDPLLYWATNAAIKGLQKIEEEGTDYEKGTLKEWRRITRLLLKNGLPVSNLLVELEQSVVDLAKEQWKGFELPNFNEEERSKIEVNLPPNIRKMNIIDIARYYGLKVKGKKAICPFHEDKDPSLSFDVPKQLFHCFGCKKSGDIITFVQLMEELKSEKK